jgi:hypothetical protein
MEPDTMEPDTMEPDTMEPDSQGDDQRDWFKENLQFEQMSALWVVKLREVHNVSQSSTKEIIMDAQNLFRVMISQIKSQLLDKGVDENIVKEVLEKNTYTKVFSSVKTNYLQEKYLKTSSVYVEPIEITLGRNRKTVGSGFKRRNLVVNDSFFYIPIIETVRAIYNCPKMLQKFNLQSPSADPSKLFDFRDGTTARRGFFTDERNLQLYLYYDDVEICNPLGSKKKIHKIGFFYFTLGNFFPKERSKISCIFLCAMAKVSIIKKYSINTILEPIVTDIKKLEDGVKIFVNGESVELKGSIAIFCGDNPASSLASGFKESGSALHPCRQCMICHSDIGKQFTESKLVLRDKTSHLKQLEELEESDNPTQTSKMYGVNSRSALLNLTHFDMCGGGMVPDIMHDILEGVLQLEMKLLLRQLIKNKDIDLTSINDKIRDFELGYIEVKDRPSNIDATSLNDDKDGKLGQSATQMWLLGRLFPIMFGRYVLEGDMYWSNFLKLLRIMDYLFSPVIYQEDFMYLKVSIHNKIIFCKSIILLISFKQLFFDNNMLV